MENNNTKNYLIVESQNDKFFIEAFISHLQLPNIVVSDATVCHIDDYECMNGLNPNKLSQAINHIKDKADKIDSPIRLGILIDWDSETLHQRLELVNTAIKTVFANSEQLSSINQFIQSDDDFKIACYFNGIDQKGELETVLKAIASKDSRYADCLEAWQQCLEDTPISQKEFDKFWVAQYIRYDTCFNKEKKQVSVKCSFQAAMKKPIWGFDMECLNELKDFLNLFNETDKI